MLSLLPSIGQMFIMRQARTSIDESAVLLWRSEGTKGANPNAISFPLGATTLRVVFEMATPGDRECLLHLLESNPASLESNPARIDFQKLSDRGAFFLSFADIEPTKDGLSNLSDWRLDAAVVDAFIFDSATSIYMGRQEVIKTQFTSKCWLNEIAILKRSASLWKMIREDDKSKLANHIRWEITPSHGISVVYTGPSYDEGAKNVKETIADGNSPKMRGFIPGDTLGPATAYLAQVIDENLRDGVQTRVFSRGVRQRTFGKVGDNSDNDPGLYLVPKNPLKAIWLELAEALVNNKRFDRCRECGAWFELAREKASRERQFCSDACKVEAYRKRKSATRSADETAE
jgi:hypothetical protein